MFGQNNDRTVSIEDFLSTQPAPIVELVMKLRRLVKSVAPADVWERAYPDWRIIKYDESVLIGPLKDGAYIGLTAGGTLAELGADPQGLMSPAPKDLRRVTVKVGTTPQVEALKALIKAAFDLESGALNTEGGG
jgi:hypothetical protein